jgi:hypothetical protein
MTLRNLIDLVDIGQFQYIESIQETIDDKKNMQWDLSVIRDIYRLDGILSNVYNFINRHNKNIIAMAFVYDIDIYSKFIKSTDKIYLSTIVNSVAIYYHYHTDKRYHHEMTRDNLFGVSNERIKELYDNNIMDIKTIYLLLSMTYTDEYIISIIADIGILQYVIYTMINMVKLQRRLPDKTNDKIIGIFNTMNPNLLYSLLFGYVRVGNPNDLIKYINYYRRHGDIDPIKMMELFSPYLLKVYKFNSIEYIRYLEHPYGITRLYGNVYECILENLDFEYDWVSLKGVVCKKILFRVKTSKVTMSYQGRYVYIDDRSLVDDIYLYGGIPFLSRVMKPIGRDMKKYLSRYTPSISRTDFTDIQIVQHVI